MDKRQKAKKAAARERHRHNVLLMRGFAIVLGAFLIINLITPSRSYSQSENRSLAERPKPSAETLADGTYFSDFNSYYADQFFLRDGWISLNFIGNYLMGSRSFEQGFVGKKGHLYPTQTEPDQDAVNNTAAAIKDFADRHSDLNNTLMLVPDATTVQPQYLPANATTRDQAKDISDFESQVQGSVNCVDVTSALSKHSEEYIYYKTDHHWTSLGARYAFEAAQSALNISADATLEDHLISTNFQGTLSSRSGDHFTSDEIHVYSLKDDDTQYYVTIPDTEETTTSIYDMDSLNQKDQYTVFLGGNHPLVEIETNADNSRSLLILKDSYANSFVQFLLPYYSTIVIVDPRYYYNDIETVLTSYAVTDVLFLYSADTLLADTVLADTLNSGTETDTTAADTSSSSDGTESVTGDSTASDSTSSDSSESVTGSSTSGSDTTGSEDSTESVTSSSTS